MEISFMRDKKEQGKSLVFAFYLAKIIQKIFCSLF
ncbi:Hypothetical Protein MfeM64YM_0350 [Mycoplasmopsis fermentans M64]|uniref:Uncharacterized protein n=1 Tax=Mycoplasmopsis fermentans (strain M64) TaxID=943945 RepID=A0AB32XB35_MYCFM|nr:Hypothetical Protein MfeM64YM_0350 [Mycoplasmopsis fermentans M64]